MAGELVLLTSSGCHMCAQARATLDELGVGWRELSDDTADGEQRARAAPPLRPVLFDGDGRVVAYGRLSARRLRRDIERGRVQAIAASSSSGLHR